MKYKRLLGYMGVATVALLAVHLDTSFADGLTSAAASAASTFSSDGDTALASIGGAIIGLAGVAVLYKWVKAMFFG